MLKVLTRAASAILNGDNNSAESNDESSFLFIFDEAMKSNSLVEFSAAYMMCAQQPFLIDVINFNNLRIAKLIIPMLCAHTHMPSPETILSQVNVTLLLGEIILLILNCYKDNENSVIFYTSTWKLFYKTKQKNFLYFLKTVQPNPRQEISWAVFSKFILHEMDCPIQDIVESSKFHIAAEKVHDMGHDEIIEWFDERKREDEEKKSMAFFDTFSSSSRTVKSHIELKNVINDIPWLKNVCILSKSSVKDEIQNHIKFKEELEDITPFSIDTLLDRSLYYDDSVELLVLRGDAINGFLIYEDKMSHSSCILSSLAIDKKLRNKGLGKILLGVFLIMQKRRGLHWCILDAVTMAHNFYMRFGFQNIKCIKNFFPDIIREGEYNFALNLLNIDENSILLNMMHDIPVYAKEWRKRPFRQLLMQDLVDNQLDRFPFIANSLANISHDNLKLLASQVIAPTISNKVLFEEKSKLIQILKPHFHASMLSLKSD
jgi:ribosomal protein S18 acetylase RimI-like enzyme